MPQWLTYQLWALQHRCLRRLLGIFLTEWRRGTAEGLNLSRNVGKAFSGRHTILFKPFNSKNESLSRLIRSRLACGVAAGIQTHRPLIFIVPMNWMICVYVTMILAVWSIKPSTSMRHARRWRPTSAPSRWTYFVHSLISWVLHSTKSPLNTYGNSSSPIVSWIRASYAFSEFLLVMFGVKNCICKFNKGCVSPRYSI